jgi:sialate O-acetylesterase
MMDCRLRIADCGDLQSWRSSLSIQKFDFNPQGVSMNGRPFVFRFPRDCKFPVVWLAVANLLVNLLFCLLSVPASAQRRLPREDVVEVPAIGQGLCLSNLFQSNMVLQRDKPISIWGWGDPGGGITVTFLEQQAVATVGDDRYWETTLPAVPVQRTPCSLQVSDGSTTLTLENILVGDVWVLGGQSNMEFELSKVENGNLEIVSAHYPEIRILTVPYAQGPAKVRSFPRLDEWSDWFGRHFRKGDWDPCTPEIASDLSAIGFVFARRIHQAAQVPIGVIDVSRGGTTVETWTPLGVLQQMLDSPATQVKLADFARRAEEWDPQADLQNRILQHEQWLQQQQEAGNTIPADRQSAPNDLRPGPIGDANYPGHCYAGMIGPLEGLAVKGVIFHQGYNNTFEGSLGAEMYRDILPEMIRAWRGAFGDARLPFGILSLCTEGDPQTREDYCEKMFNAGIDIRAAHYSTFCQLYDNGDRNIGYASTYDLRRRWYHPQVKIPAGERIARWALATQYGFERQLEWKPPRLVELQRLENGLCLTFDREVGDPEEGSIVGFAIAGEDRRFHPAEVAYREIATEQQDRPEQDRKQLVLTSPLVPQPIHFRYAWGRNPLANLQAIGNKDLPVATQKSDDWPMEQVPLGIVEGEHPRPLPRREQNLILQALRQQDTDRRLQEAQRLIDQLGKRN